MPSKYADLPKKSNLPAKGKTNSLVSSSYNKSGIALTGVGGSGSASVKDIPTNYGKRIGDPKRFRQNNPNTAIDMPTGSGTVKTGTTKVGSGDNTRYIDVPEANKDRGKVSTPTNSSVSGLATTLKNASGEASAKKPTGSGTDANPSAPRKNTEPASDKATESDSGGKMTLNDFMRIASSSGKTNAYRRGYQMFKNYQKTGKLPSRRVGPDK